MGLHLRGNILGYEEVKAPKKLVVTGARNTFEAHKMFDQIEFHEKECLPFYDLHLKGKNNGFMEARAGAHLRARRERLARRGAMAAEARDVRAVLSAQGAVGQRHLDERRRPVDREAAGRRSRPPATPIRTGSGSTASPSSARTAGVDPVRRVLTFTTAPLDERSRGHRADRAQAVRVVDRDRHAVHRQAHRPAAAGRGGAQEPATQPAYHAGVEGLAQGLAPREGREALDAERPFYTHTNPQPLTPGEIYEFDIEVLPISYVFKKGHRIRLELANGDLPATDGVFSHPYHPTQMGTDTIHHDAGARVVHHAAGGRDRRTP